MADDKVMIVAGIGCRRGATAEEIEAVIMLALDRVGLALRSLDALGTIVGKAEEPGLCEAARRLSLPLMACSAEDLRAVIDRIVTPSLHAEAAIGVPSVAEAAALAAAGPSARLCQPRVATAQATCAIAESGER